MKNKILILLVSLFSIFIISDRVDALSYTVNDIEYQVNSLETLRDYCYFTKVKNDSSIIDLVVIEFTGNYYSGSDFCIYIKQSSKIGYNQAYYFMPLNSSRDYNPNFDKFTNYNFDYNASNINAWYFNPSTSFYSIPIYRIVGGSLFSNANFSFNDIENKYNVPPSFYDIKYYLNNELYDTITVEGGSSHTLKDNPSYDSTTQYWSGWTYDSNIDLSNITSDVNIYGTITDKNNYIITYYLNNEVYRTDSVIEGNSYILLDYVPPKNYNFSGWSYDENYNFNDVRENMEIYGTSVFVRPGMNYSEDIDSPIHNLSVSILGREIPVEFDFLYTIMDFIILILLVICVIAPFIIVFKLLGGGF